MALESRGRNIPTEPRDGAFTSFLWGQEKLDRRKSILKAFAENPIFSKTNVILPSIARKDAWTRAALQARELIKLKLSQGWSHTQFMEAIRLTDNMLPVQPQFRIFLSNLERQMSDEQKAIWVPKAERFEIFGSYAQTELGHGSNVRGLETTATFDRDKDEFVINSPTLSSTKYWIGTTGVWATHSIVVARLIIDGKQYGNHLFLTQIRDLDTQRLMPGVEIYELGPKAFQGMLGTDNGAMQFHSVRIPRSQMLARNAQVLRDGTYVKPKNTKHSYGSMVTVRAIMAESTGWDLLKPVAVAYHYTTFRKQFRRNNDQSQETTVIDYASVQHRLIPLLAQATALVLVGQNIKRGYDAYTADYIKTGDFSKLEDFHLQTVGAKVYSTEIAGHGVETCRIMCGGHGYHALSGFGRMYANTINAVTYEGDNYVVGQQVPRAILKHWRDKTEASLPTLSYLTKLRDRSKLQPPRIESEEDWFRPEVQRWALEERLVNLVQQHLEDTEAGRDTSYACHALTMAHGDFVYWKGFEELLMDLESKQPAFLQPVQALFQVFGLSILQSPHHPSLASALSLSQAQIKHLRLAKSSAIRNLVEHHLADIIEAYGFTDFELDSALARPDKNPYEALFEEGAVRSEMSGNGMSHMWPMMVDTRSLWRKIEEEKAGKAKL
jgi:acyl-CoA oxidase